MSNERDRTDDSEQTEPAVDRIPRDGPTPRPDEPFDPFKSQSIAFSTEFFRKLISKKPPRLEPEYFQDTLPPTRGVTSGVTSESTGMPTNGPRDAGVEPTEARIPSRTRRWVVGALLVGVAVLLIVIAATRQPVPASDTPPAAREMSTRTIGQIPANTQALGEAAPEPSVTGEHALAPLTEGPEKVAPSVAVASSSALPTVGPEKLKRHGERTVRTPSASPPIPSASQKTSVFDMPLIPAANESAPR